MKRLIAWLLLLTTMVVSKGSLDLKTEALSFGFKATPNNMSNISAGEFLNSFIMVGGTLDKPEVGL